jgi:hypothetical protein
VGSGACSNVLATTIGGSSASIQEVHAVPQISLYLANDFYHKWCTEQNERNTHYHMTYECEDYDYEVCQVRRLKGPIVQIGWMVNSSASSHFTHDLNDFDTLEDCQIEVTIGDGSLVKCTKKGTVK